MTSYRYARGDVLIALERDRQINAENWTPEHDDRQLDGALAMAAVAYALPVHQRLTTRAGYPPEWPWLAECWKPCPDDRVRELVKAGALIAAEIDRLQRHAAPAEPAAPEHDDESDDDGGDES